MKVEVPADWSQWESALGMNEKDDEGYTVVELAKKAGIPKATMKDRISKASKDGKMIRGIATRVNESGRRYRVAVYRLAKSEDQ